MDRVYIGVDPGKTGAFAIIEDGKARVYPWDVWMFKYAMERFKGIDCVACVEHVWARPGQGQTSTFTFGTACGFIHGMLFSNDIPYELVTPQKWKKEFSITGDKNSSIAVCRRLFPDVSLRPTERCRKDNDGMAEALLMAEYARRRL